MNRLEGEFDAVLNLLDRQVIDVDGLMVCKVDDLQLHDRGGGSLWVTGILVGPAALLPRFSGHIGRSLLEQWRRLGLQQADRTIPWCLDLDLVDEVTNSVRLTVSRAGLLRKPAAGADDAAYRRLDHLLGMRVHHGDAELGRVLDVRVTPRNAPDGLECTHLVVGRARPGAMLGYDRGGHRGPALLSHLIRWIHRHTGQISTTQISEIDWAAGKVTVRGELDELTHA